MHPAELVISELVSNAVRHAGTDLRVTVSRRGTGLYLAVRDGSTVLPPLADRSGAAPGTRPEGWGFGLWLVDQIADAWGAQPMHQRTGKVVWATVRRRLPSPRVERSTWQPPTPSLAVGPAKATALAPLLPPLVELSAREQEVLSYLPTMLTADDIATQLHMSVNTVKAHLRSVYRKLGASRRHEAIKRGLL